MDLLEHLGIVNLEAQTAPVVREAYGKDWIEYGTEEYRNLYPQFLVDLYYNSSTHAAIVNQTASMIAGSGLQIEDETNLDALVKLKKFMASANSKETLQEVITKIAFDLKLQGAYALNVIWSKDKLEISEIYHIGVEKIRAGKPNEMGVVDTYWVSPDWSNHRNKNNKPIPVPAFNTKDRTSPNQILYTSLYSPMMDIYGVPDYSGCTNWCLTDQYVSEFHLSNIKNGFSGSFFINFNNGVPTREERLTIEKQIQKKFSGPTNSGKIVLAFSDDKNREPTITPVSVSNADKQYLALQELLVQNILTGHRVTSPMLMGIKNDTGLGNNADELNQAFEVYLNSVVKPFQANILKTLAKIFEVNQMNLPVSIKQFTPVSTKFDNDTLKDVMTQDELRGELGLEPLDNEETANEELSKQDKEFNTLLDDWLEAHGEEIPKDWELLDEEDSDGELADFNFENELNNLVRTELASVGKSNPNAKSDQDRGVINKGNWNYFRVRYVYNEDKSLTRTSENNSRPFCEKMMLKNKVYRKEDIAPIEDGGLKHSLSEQPVNRGWGEGGADIYDIWKYKGGGNCHHRWYRQIYKTVIGEGSSHIDDASIISTTKARSEGLKPEANAQEVPVAPKQMETKGFVNPELIEKYS